jgi:hypothetical protein
MSTATSIFAQIVDKVRLLDDEQQKLLWLQLNKEALFASAAKTGKISKAKTSMDEVVKLTRYVRSQKKKN